MTALPDSIGDLPSLQKLDLRRTPLSLEPLPGFLRLLQQRGCVVLS